MNVDTDINPGNSGGLAADDDGRIIGIPTLYRQVGPGEPVGSIRPIDLAKPLIDAARAGEDYESKVPLRPLEDEEITNVGIGALGNRIGFEDSCGTGEGVGSDAIAISFDYSGFSEGEHQDVLVAVVESGADEAIAVWSNVEEFPFRSWGEEGCATVTVAAESELGPGAYEVAVLLGPSLEVVARGNIRLRPSR